MFLNLSNLFRYRGLIQSLVARELKARYRGSVLGFFWSFVNPLLLLLIYSFVFTTVMPNETKGIQPYALFMFCGILPWNWFSSSLSEATGGRMYHANRIEDLNGVFEQVAAELRTVYSIGYTPSNLNFDGRFRRIRVQVNRPDVATRTRPG